MANIKEAAKLYIETLLHSEKRKIAKKQIVTTAMEVSAAWAATAHGP